MTDFGFSDTDGGQVAYLVMEYLDGCTLGEILEEKKISRWMDARYSRTGLLGRP